MELPIDEAVYRTALERIEELLSMVSDKTPTYDPKTIELKIMSDIVIGYEEAHFPIGNPSCLSNLPFTKPTIPPKFRNLGYYCQPLF